MPRSESTRQPRDVIGNDAPPIDRRPERGKITRPGEGGLLARGRHETLDRDVLQAAKYGRRDGEVLLRSGVGRGDGRGLLSGRGAVEGGGKAGRITEWVGRHRPRRQCGAALDNCTFEKTAV